MLCIGFAGGSGSGKTTLVRSLVARFAPYATLLSHDDYYKAHDDIPYSQRVAINYDEPDALDTALFFTHLTALRNGKTILRPTYDFEVHNRSDHFVPVTPTPILLAEGILLFTDDAVASLFDLRVFVDTDADIRFIRRMYRDTTERGRSLESVVAQYQNTVKPMHEKYVEPQRRAAHLIIPENGENQMAETLLAAYIESYLRCSFHG